MKKVIFVVFDTDAQRIYARAVTIGKAVLEYYAQEEIAYIIGNGNSVMAFPPEAYNGPIEESITFDIKRMGDYVATIIKKEDKHNV